MHFLEIQQKKEWDASFVNVAVQFLKLFPKMVKNKVTPYSPDV